MKLEPLPDALARDENRDVLRLLRDQSAHSDVVDALLGAAAPLGDVQGCCPDPSRYAYVLLATRGVVFAFAVGMNRAAFRLDPTYRQRALDTGAEDLSEAGPGWVVFELFRSNFPAVDLAFWARKAYALARGEDPD